MKHFIKLTDHISGNLLCEIAETAENALKNISPDGVEDLVSNCSGLISKDEADVVMTYVFVHHYKQIQRYFGSVDLFNFINKTVYEDI